MLTNATVKLVKRLQQKKYRKEYGLFVVEGKKSIDEFFSNHFKVRHFFVNSQFHNEYPMATLCTSADFKHMSGLKTPPEILAVFEQKKHELPEKITQTYFALDNIKDPGNLGTIIRLADWFGMEHLFCNMDSVEVYNPKVIQASMGSLGRVKVHYVDLPSFLSKLECDIYGTFMQGENIYTTSFGSEGIIVMGNESNGISKDIEALCTKKITIPQVPNRPTESLNVAVASAIISGEIFRQKLV